MFNITYNDIVDKIVPARLQKESIKSLLYVMVKPIQTLHSSFISFRDGTNYKLLFNGQVIYLEHYLNDVYDPVNREIYIEDTANLDYDYTGNKIENRPDLYLVNKTEIPPESAWIITNQVEYNSQVEFIVKIPVAVSYNEIIMRDQIKKYTIAGKRFNINTY